MFFLTMSRRPVVAPHCGFALLFNLLSKVHVRFQIAGPKSTTVPQAGLATKARAGPLAQLIVKAIVDGADPDNQLLYNSLNWEFANNTQMPALFDWLQPPVNTVINGRQDMFSQKCVLRASPPSGDDADALRRAISDSARSASPSQ